MQFFHSTANPFNLVCLCVFLAVVGCASKPTNPTGKVILVPATHQVKLGDTVSKIAQEYNLNWREISELNNLDHNHTIYAGQILQLPILENPTLNTIQTPSESQILVAKPTVTPPTPSKSMPQPLLSPTPPEPEAPEFRLPPNPAAANPPIIGASEVMQFDYPVGQNNRVVKGFGAPLRNGSTEGIFFAGQAGDSIYASNTGTVIYANNAPNHRPMIMIEHTKGYISTYFDVNDVQVKSGEKVNKGDKLGVMITQTQGGHALFEFRIAKHGRYIDPITVLK